MNQARETPDRRHDPRHDPRPRQDAAGRAYYACPVCEGPARRVSGSRWHCPICNVEFVRDGKRE